MSGDQLANYPQEVIDQYEDFVAKAKKEGITFTVRPEAFRATFCETVLFEQENKGASLTQLWKIAMKHYGGKGVPERDATNLCLIP